ncbi:uncharacterized protein [Bemisia tabaci]|uniref:uncharacterized protein n=1 Tax=Bemisia tabaci TaxID=7038 RepID=UPI003B281DFC
MSREVNYVYCFVPSCKNTSLSTPDKIFFSVPYGVLRKEWCGAVGRSPNSLSEKTHRKCCEDHFNLEKDVTNWYEYKIIKEAGTETALPTLRLRKGVLPKIVVST